MSKTFDCTNCGLCCGPVPVTKSELSKIKREVKKMSLATMYRLQSQERSALDCIFRDIENDKCSIYRARPDICQMFGFYEDLVCPNNPEHATRSREEGYKRIDKKVKNDPVAGLLSVDITWNNILNK